jgi:hypothetical protein
MRVITALLSVQQLVLSCCTSAPEAAPDKRTAAAAVLGSITNKHRTSNVAAEASTAILLQN